MAIIANASPPQQQQQPRQQQKQRLTTTKTTKAAAATTTAASAETTTTARSRDRTKSAAQITSHLLKRAISVYSSPQWIPLFILIYLATGERTQRERERCDTEPRTFCSPQGENNSRGHGSNIMFT